MAQGTNKERKRIALLDGWRGSAVLLMIIWHFCWDLTLFGVFPQKVMYGTFAVTVRYIIVFSFVLLSGISCCLSHNNLARGIQALACAGVITLVTWLAGDPAWFGILHLLGCCILLYAAAEKAIKKIPVNLGVGVGLALFSVCLLIHERVYVSTPGLWIFGLRTVTFSSSDYYPLIPWMFLFLAGAIAGEKILHTEGKWREIEPPRFLCRVGRYALPVYLIHQPVLLAIIALCAEKLPQL